MQYPATFQLASETNQNSPLVLGETSLFKALDHQHGNKVRVCQQGRRGMMLGRHTGVPTTKKVLAVALKENFPLAKLS